MEDILETVLQVENQQPELLPELENIGVKIVSVPFRTGGTRKKFINLKPEYLQFKPGQRVLPAPFVGMVDQGPIYFVKKHEPGESHWKDGGYECVSIGGGVRAFFLDALMLHPSEMKKSERIEVGGLRTRGRKRIKPIVVKDPNAPKGKRGRKPLSEEEKQKRELEKQNKPKGTGKRGRPKMDPALKKSKPYVKTGGKRGRPKKQLN